VKTCFQNISYSWGSTSFTSMQISARRLADPWRI